MKKLTDKIYIAESNSHPGFFAQEYFLPHKWGRFKSIEYIRKDALLEWAKKNNKRIDTEDGDYTLGYVSAMIDLIEKLNSM